MLHALSAGTAIRQLFSALHTAELTSMTTAHSDLLANATLHAVTPDSSVSTIILPGAGAPFPLSARGIRSASSGSSAAAARLQPTSTTSSAPRSTSRCTTATRLTSLTPTTCAGSATPTTATRLRWRTKAFGRNPQLRSTRTGRRGRGSNPSDLAPATGSHRHLCFRSERFFS